MMRAQSALNFIMYQKKTAIFKKGFDMKIVVRKIIEIIEAMASPFAALVAHIDESRRINEDGSWDKYWERKNRRESRRAERRAKRGNGDV